uniref:Brevican core protein n=1 Tax=Denticeps clupeoides TaxID=299321 RepID=A0AAY4DQD7_9TELE
SSLEMFQSLLLSSICLLVSLSTATADHASEDTRLLQVIIHKTPPPSAILGGSLTLPCLVSHPLPTTSTLGRHAVLSMPRVKWSVLSSKRETEILVARGERVKVNEAYKNRARLLNYASSPTDLTLQLDDLNHNDTGFYRCEVQHGLEDAHDLVHIKVKGVVFHYRHASSRYAFTFDQAQDACEDIGAQIATPEQLLAEYNSGYEQCDAGWLADGSVRYPIQMPREGCFGDMDGMPGVRNYGMLDPYELYDVYCYVENIKGEVIHGPIPQRLTLAEAKAFCESKDAELATTGQLYAAWNDGLNHCSPGWLADGSVRYPIVIPRERCGGSEPGVKTVYRYNNQTGFPEPHTHHDVYCFRATTEPDHLGEDIVTMTDPQEEFSFGQVTQQAENEALGAVEFIPLSSISDVGTEADQLPTQIYPKDHTLPDSQTADFISMIPESTQGPWQVSTNQVSLESVPQTYWKARDTDRSEDDYTYQHPEDSKGSKGHNDNGGDLKIYLPTMQINLEADTLENSNQTTTNLPYTLETPMPPIVEEEPLALGPEETFVLATSHYEDENTNHSDYTTLSHIWENSTNSATTEASGEVSNDLMQTELPTPVDLEDNGITTTIQSEELATLISQESDPFTLLDNIHTTQGFDSTQELETGGTSLELLEVSHESADHDLNSKLSLVPTTSMSSLIMRESAEGSGIHDDDIPASPSSGPTATHLARDLEIHILESTTPGFRVIEGGLERVEQEGLGENINMLYTTTTQVPDTITDLQGNDQDEGESEDSSGVGHDSTEFSNTTAATHFSLPDDLDVNAVDSYNVTNTTGILYADLNITFVPDTTHTPSWDTTSSPTLQESRSDLEYSGDAPVTVEVYPDSSSEQIITMTATPALITPEPDDVRSPSTTLAAVKPDIYTNLSPTTAAPDLEDINKDDATPTGLVTYKPLPSQRAVIVRTGNISDACMENPCANGGTCVENGSTPRCLCLPTYGGDFCQVDLEHCEPGWEKFQGSCYRHFTKRQSWEVAEKHCRMCGGHLVSLMTPEEQEFINDKYREYQWTGLNDRTIEGDFRWSDGNPLLYENWYRGQPDSYFLSGENCVVMVWHDDGHWSDVPCNYHLSYTCKKGISFCGKPPTVLHGKTFGRRRLRYETNSKVRYYCQGGFVQRQNPVIKCLPTGKWEKPLVTCTPVTTRSLMTQPQKKLQSSGI